MIVVLFMDPLDVAGSWGDWNVTGEPSVDSGFWYFGGVSAAHILIICFTESSCYLALGFLGPELFINI